MHIKKSDLIQLAQEVQASRQDTTRQDKTAPSPTVSGEPTSAVKTIQVDTLRNQVMNLHQDVKDLQTKISFHQMQLAFLEQLRDNSNWRAELQRFMQERLNTANFSLPKTADLTEFTQKTQETLANLNNNLLKKEIQLQNILSTGMLSEEQVNISLFKDISQNRELFTKLKPEAVANLLKQS